MAVAAEGRVISMTFHVTMTPREPVRVLGHTDAPFEIGRGLIREAMLLLKNAGSAEGFDVDVDATQVVY